MSKVGPGLDLSNSAAGSEWSSSTVQCVVVLASPEKLLEPCAGTQGTWTVAPGAQLGQDSQDPAFAEAK